MSVFKYHAFIYFMRLHRDTEQDDCTYCIHKSPVQERYSKRRVPLSYPPPYSYTQLPCLQLACCATPTLSCISVQSTLIVY
jgi:hypothetical protein